MRFSGGLSSTTRKYESVTRSSLTCADFVAEGTAVVVMMTSKVDVAITASAPDAEQRPDYVNPTWANTETFSHKIAAPIDQAIELALLVVQLVTSHAGNAA